MKELLERHHQPPFGPAEPRHAATGPLRLAAGSAAARLARDMPSSLVSPSRRARAPPRRHEPLRAGRCHAHGLHAPHAGEDDGMTESAGSEGGPQVGGRSVAHNTAALAAGTLAARIAMFGLGIVLARELGVDDYGRFGLGVALGTILVPLTDFGASSYLARDVARSRERGEGQLPALIRVRLLSAGVGNILAFAAVFLLVDDGKTEAAIMLALGAAAFDGLAQFGYGYFEGLERMDVEAKARTLTSLVRAIGGIAIALTLGSLVAVLVWLLVVGVAQAAWSARLLQPVRRALRGQKQPLPAPTWRTVLAMGTVTIFVMITLRADTVLIGALQSEREVGWYTAAWTLMSGLQILPWTISVALGPVFARTFWTDEAAYRRTWQQGLRAVLLISLPMALLVSLLAGPVVGRLFGADYAPAVTALAIVIWSLPLAALNSVATLALRGAGRERTLTIVFGLGAIGNIGVNLWAIPRFGIDGAAAVNIGTEAAIFAGLMAMARHHRLVVALRLRLLRLLLALGVLAGLAVAIRDHVPVELALLVPTLGYGGVALVLGLVSREELRTLRPRRA
ncbi:MAG: flippase [Actinomycetota bacterium]|nr:flippase [Actinomycetota bacterium]